MQTIYLDISNKGAIPTIYAKQGDVGRRFLAVLTDAGVPYSPPAGSAFSVWYDGDSGDGNYTDIGGASAFSVNANTVSVELITQMLEKDGEGILCLVLSRADGKQISLWNIPYTCEFVPGYESEEANSYFTAFSDAVKNLPYPDTSLSVPGKAADSGAVGTALVGKAPAGFGYGETLTSSFWNDEDGTQLEASLDSFFNSVDKLDKVYRFKLADYPACVVSGQGGFADIMCSDIQNGVPLDITIVYYALMGGVTIATKKKHAGGWYPWEYLNPPMLPGVEYRTTERFNGKPVYCRHIDGETLPIGTKIYKVADNAILFHVFGPNITTVNFGGNIPSTLQSENVISCFINGDSAIISCGGNRSNVSFYFIAKYTKTTD